MQHHTVQCISPTGLHRMHYTEWGARDNPRIVVCVHGLTRNCRDFDALAQSLEKDFRVVCPDIAGRGQSEWLLNKQQYGLPQYAADITTLFARLTADGEREVLWVGTSMGGMIGMVLSCLPQTPIRKLVLNDVGTLIPKESLERIGKYVGKAPAFKTYEETVAYLRSVSAPFGPLTDAQWDHLTRHNVKQTPDGQWTMKFLRKRGDNVTLLPANPKYQPIQPKNELRTNPEGSLPTRPTGTGAVIEPIRFHPTFTATVSTATTVPLISACCPGVVENFTQ